MGSVFEDIIKPSLDCIPVLEVMHSEWHDGIKYRITQSVKRNVFNEFDRKLSNHLAATKDRGFPSCQVTVEIVDLRSKAEPQNLPPTYYDSIPHALKEIAKRAFARVGPVELMLQRGDRNPGQILPVCHRRKIDASYIALFEQGLGVCEHLGATAFLRLSGEFDLVEITPPGGVDPVTLRLRNGTVLVPSVDGPKRDRFEWPIVEFAGYASSNVSAQTYVASVRHAIVTEKEAAILAFRSAAEQRIHDFDHALAGRHLDGHWLTGASALITRLKAGLGEDMTGISEAARGKALDWCEEIQRAQKPSRATARRVSNRNGYATPVRAAT